MDRHDLALTDLLLYGVLVAYVHRGVSPRVSDLATVMRVRDPERVRERLRRLIDRGLIRGDHTPGRGQRVRYTLLGPTCSGKAA
jgi:predicted transcriptional regulator